MKNPTMPMLTSVKPKPRKSLLAAALSSLLLVAGPLAATTAIATDLGTTVASAGSQGQYVRMGLGKSVVMHLPGEAKDVIVGDNDVVDAVIRNKSTVYLFARKPGQTNLFFLDANGQQIMALDLEVAQDALPLTKLIQRTLPGTHITVDVINDRVVLGGIALNAAEAKTAFDLAGQFVGSEGGGGKVLNTIKIAGEDQVMLQVKVVEMQRDVLKQWGINLKAVLNAGSFAFNLASINPFANSLIGADQAYGASASSGGNSISGIIRAMESDGMIHTLAEPNLTAMSGQPAIFKAGGQYPYQVCSVTATGRDCQISFKDYGVDLEFTPTVLTAGRINLKIHTSVSELNTLTTGAQNVPGLNNRSADTTLELGDGSSMMLAGLIRENTRQTINGTPGLRQLPVLGALFRSRDFISNQTELVVLVTPHIVRSLAQKQLESPDDNLNIATDRQTLLLGRLNKVYGGKGKPPVGNYQGNVGYIVE